tara:strand:- start:207 stop:344 length:138 start_codon:yes stop_codon:yes gene_type:complete
MVNPKLTALLPFWVELEEIDGNMVNVTSNLTIKGGANYGSTRTNE